MKKFLKNEKGSVLVMSAAIIVCIVSAFSAVSLLGMVANGQLQTQFDHDAIQEELLLRSEAVRGHLAMEHNNNSWPPPRYLQINQEDRLTFYEIQTKTENTYVSLILGQPVDLAIAVRSKIICKRGTSRKPLYTSPVVRLSERLIKSQSLAQFQYFTDTEASENEDGGPEAARVKFWGPDVLHGPVHSNTDIWIQQAGGGNNGGWPTFYSKVTTAGRVRVHPSGGLAVENAPVNSIFLGGLEEEINGVVKIIFLPDASQIIENGVIIGEDADIVYARLNGNTAETRFGYINSIGTEDFDVYSWYPRNLADVTWCIQNGGNWFEDTNIVWTNEIVLYDTTWQAGPTVSWGQEGTFWVPTAELWIEGDMTGKATWGCGNTVYITGDITYGGTPPGSPPDLEGNMNPSDFFGLVSEKSVLVRYKHRDPFDADYPIVSVNCDEHVYLYGAYAALGLGDPALGSMACHEDGIFTFQYQHPHGSTPNFRAPSPYTGYDTLYTYIDLHKFIFPITGYIPNPILGFNLHGGDPVYQGVNYTCGYPLEDPLYRGSYPNNNQNNYAYPYGTDYPWYNPVWPESALDIVSERGTIHIWGAIAQRRRGFIHRSGTDPYNHTGDNQWDMDVYHYDGAHGLTGLGSGYEYKDYHYDNRFLYVQPPNYPEVYEGWGESSIATFDKQAWVYKSPVEW